jgi:hypothetical protein
MNKYLTGIGRGADKKDFGRMDSAKFECCALKFQEPYRGKKVLPEKYYHYDKKSVGFRSADNMNYIKSYDKMSSTTKAYTKL